MWLPYLVLAGVVAMTAAASYSARTSSASNDRLRFDNAVQRTADAITERINTHVDILRAGAGLFAADREVSREEFRRFVERIEVEKRHPGAQGVGFTARVTAGGREAFVDSLRRQGLEEFRLRPEGEREEYQPVTYIEPQDGRNLAALGYDMLSEPVRREAMARARDTGQPAAAGRVTLVQEVDERKQPGFLIYVPVYRGGEVPAAVEARREALRGFVYSPFRAGDLLGSIFGTMPFPLCDVVIYEGDAASPENLLHRSDAARGEPAPESYRPRFTAEKTLDVGGRPWRVTFFTRRGSDIERAGRTAPLIALTGAAFGLALFFVTRSQVRARARTEAATASLRASENRFRTLVEQSPVSTQIFSPDGRTVRVNRAWEELWGVTLETLGGYNILEDRQLEEKGIAAFIRRGFAGEPTAVPAILYDPEESIPGVTSNEDPRRWVSAVIYPVKDETGRVREVVLIHEDITERVRAEGEARTQMEAAESARREAEEASRLKDEFLATLSHELRTPLTAILGWAKLLRAGGIEPEFAARGLEAVERNAVAQTRLIGDLLDVSRIITGKLRLEPRAVELWRIVEAGVEGVRPTADARGVILELGPGAGEAPVSGDPDRLQQVVWNLLSNAVKFTPRGGHVRVRLTRAGGYAEVEVSDTGRGIAAEFLPHVFDRFRQADGRITREHGGLGLGLSIARHLVELHGGTITAESDGEDRGATFRFSLPLLETQGAGGGARDEEGGGGAEDHTPPAARRPSLLEGLRVVVVDDDRDSREVVAAALARAGALVTEAASADEAFAAVSRLRPDVLVADIGMPGEDGYSLIARVRALGADAGGGVPAAALTAYARRDDRARALAAGFQVHIAKPVEPDALTAAIARLAGRQG
jgi:PAS domain S-box-containing protein